MNSSKYTYFAVFVLLWHHTCITESSVNIAVNKNTSQSSTYGSRWESLEAVNGHQDCSSRYTHTAIGEQSAWWQVDLGIVYEIKTIKIFYRNDYKYYLQRLNGYSINVIDSQNKKWQCFKDEDASQLPATLNPIHICPRLGQYVEFSVERLPNITYHEYDHKGAVINLCEFEVYGCPPGNYGYTNCLSNCSDGCRDSRCDPDYGNCSCIDGWTGNMCQIRSCKKGNYGEDCKPCSTGCLNNNCDVTNGECTDGCLSSLYGRFCTLDCPRYCSNPTCNMDNGDCINCKSGYYGTKCNVTCPQNCKDGTCHQTSGHCFQCVEFFQGYTCTDCISGHYGKDCIACPERCVNKNCNKDNGYCTYGCNVGFYGDFCNMSCPINCKNNTCNSNTGDCTHGCKTTILQGTKCDDCIGGHYGKDCIACPEGCLNKNCSNENRHCTYGCNVGFYGDLCNMSCPINCKNDTCNRNAGDCTHGCKRTFLHGTKCDECVDGKRGENCDKECPLNCYLHKCNRFDGFCSTGCKFDHMKGAKCEGNRTTTEGQDFQINSYIGTIIAGVVSLINIVLIVIILVLYCKRRRRKETVYENQKPLDWKQEGMNQQDNNQLEQQQTVHYETLGLHDRGSVNTNAAQAYTGLNVNTQGRY